MALSEILNELKAELTTERDRLARAIDILEEFTNGGRPARAVPAGVRRFWADVRAGRRPHPRSRKGAAA